MRRTYMSLAERILASGFAFATVIAWLVQHS
jgi:hypothetical protein